LASPNSLLWLSIILVQVKGRLEPVFSYAIMPTHHVLVYVNSALLSYVAPLLAAAISLVYVDHCSLNQRQYLRKPRHHTEISLSEFVIAPENSKTSEQDVE